MSVERHMALIRRFVEEFKNHGNHSIVDDLCSPVFVHHFKDSRLPAGRDALKVLGAAVVTAFPDVHATIEDLLSDGDKVIERTAARGTHRGEFNGVPATGKTVTWTEIHIYRVAEGRIAELWSEIDFLSILMQVGAVPAPAGARA